MTGIISAPKVPPAPAIRPPTPLPTAEDARKAKVKSLRQQQKRRGRASTILSQGDVDL